MLKARKKKKRKKSPRLSFAGGALAKIPPRVRKRLLIAAGACTASLLIIATFYFYVTRLPIFMVDRERLTLAAVPAWVTPGVRREILNLPGVPERFSIFDDKAVRDVHDAYAGYSWVKEVRSIKKVYPNKLSMELVIRRPVVRVRDGNRYYLADAEGVRLSARHYDTDAALKLPYLYGMKEKIPAVGKKFAVEVAAGIEVVTVLASADFYDELDVTAIDLSNLGGRRSRTESEIVVWTATRAAITWGRSTAYAKFGELPVADKLKNLEKINGQRPGLRGLHTVRLEFDDVHYELR